MRRAIKIAALAAAGFAGYGLQAARAAQPQRDLPAWVHWARHPCGKHVPGVAVWGGNGATAALAARTAARTLIERLPVRQVSVTPAIARGSIPRTGTQGNT